MATEMALACMALETPRVASQKKKGARRSESGFMFHVTLFLVFVVFNLVRVFAPVTRRY
jgi:hypothetical protein